MGQRWSPSWEASRQCCRWAGALEVPDGAWCVRVCQFGCVAVCMRVSLCVYACMYVKSGCRLWVTRSYEDTVFVFKDFLAGGSCQL